MIKGIRRACIDVRALRERNEVARIVVGVGKRCCGASALADLGGSRPPQRVMGKDALVASDDSSRRVARVVEALDGNTVDEVSDSNDNVAAESVTHNLASHDRAARKRRDPPLVLSVFGIRIDNRRHVV